jgi:hypothetical protein
MLQILTANKPTTNTRTINSLNVLDFDGNDWLDVDTFNTPSSGDMAFFMVAEIDSIDNANDALFSIDGGTDFQFTAGNATQFDGHIDTIGMTGDNVDLTGGPFAGPSIYNLNFDYAGASVFNAYIDGTKRSTDATCDGILSNGPLAIFKNRGSQYPNGAVGEFIVCKDVTVENRQKIEGYLAHKWGLTDNLPSDHPYKTTVPTT